MNKKPAIFLCGHGSRNGEALEAFRSFVARLRGRLPDYQIDYGFLEFAEPTLAQGLENLRAQGAREIHVLALTLFEGRHAAKDIPALLHEFGTNHPELRLHYGGGLHGDEKIRAIVEDRIREAEAVPVERAKSFLLLVARGATRERAGEFYQAMADRLQKSHGFTGALAAFSGMSEPSVATGLEIAQQSGASRILVVPCFLFTGTLLKDLHKRIQAAKAMAQAADAQPEFLVATHLEGHPLLEDILITRILKKRPKDATA